MCIRDSGYPVRDFYQLGAGSDILDFEADGRDVINRERTANQAYAGLLSLFLTI